MITQCTLPVLEYPVKFLGATLLSMNANMGWGIESSTLNVELIEDCTPGSGYNPLTELIELFPADNFIGNDAEIVGAAAYFSLPAPDPLLPQAKFRFGGIITNWSTRLTNAGLTYEVTITDPREILNNTVIITDSYSDLPFQHINYYNVYAAYEAGVNYGNCSVFGTAKSSERGMNYNNILKGLLAMGALDGDTTNFRLRVYSPTTDKIGFAGLFKLDLGYILDTNDIYTSTLVTNRTDASEVPLAPENYRITDKISILELLQNICQLTGRNFYTNLVWDPVALEHVIKVNTVSLQQPIDNIFTIVPAYKGYSSELSYGRELRNEKTRKLVFGDQLHYITSTTEFTPFFGTDDFGVPIYPIRNEDGIFVMPDGTTISNCGFWIYIDISKLNVTLFNPISNESGSEVINKLWLSELDIRAALASYELWQLRTFAQTTDYSAIDDSFVKIMQNAKGYKELNIKDYVQTIVKVLSRPGQPDDPFTSSRSPINDVLINARNKLVEANQIELLDDLDKIHKFISNLGQTYYGKQFLTRLNNNICVTIDNEEADGNGFGEKVYSETPTNDGGWVDYGVSVLGLQDPVLGVFRLDDDRIKPFAMFSSDTSTGISSQKPGLPPSTPVPTPPPAPTPAP